MYFLIGFLSGSLIASINLTILYYVVHFIKTKKIKALTIILFVYFLKIIFTGFFLYIIIRNHYGSIIALLVGVTLVFLLFVIGVLKNARAS